VSIYQEAGFGCGWKTMGSALRRSIGSRFSGCSPRLHGDIYDGTGVGLAIVQKGIERVGGRVGVESSQGQAADFGSRCARYNDCTRAKRPSAAEISEIV